MKNTAGVVVRPLLYFGGVCEMLISNSLICAMDWLHDSPLPIERLTPSQASAARALLLRVVLWCSVAAAAAAGLALWLPAGLGRRRSRIRLALAHVALAFTAATHGILVWLTFFYVVVTAEASDDRLLSFIFAVGVIVFAVGDLLFFVVLLRGDGVE